MRRRLAEVRDNLTEFIQQPDAALLLVGSNHNDVGYTLKILEQFDGEDESALYVAFADDFVDEGSYAMTIAQRLCDLYAGMNEMRRDNGEPELDPFPPEMLAPATRPRDRIVIAIEHLGRRLPDARENRVVFTFMPLRISSLPAYGRLIGSFRQMAVPQRWMAYGRIIARDVPERVVGEALERVQAQGVLAFGVDFSTDALAGDLAQDAVDPSVPLAQRMQAVLQLAMIDMSYKRHVEAVKKFGLLFDYYGQADAPLMQAMCLQGVGDTLRMTGKKEEALERYQQGLAIGVAARSPLPPEPDAVPGTGAELHPNAPPILLNLLLAAGDTSMQLRCYGDAASYYQDASRVAAKCLNAYAAADALERQGDAHRELRDAKAALTVWKQVETIAESYRYYVRLESVLQRQAQLHRDAGLNARAQELDRKAQGAHRLAAGAST